MARWITIISLVLSISFSTGFIFSKSNMNLVQGVWKTEQPEGGFVRFVVIGDNYLLFDTQRLDDLIYEEKDGVIVIRNAGIDSHIGRIFIRNADQIELEELSFLGGRFKLERSSEKEMAEALNPPASKIIGQYGSEDGKLVLKITDDGIFKNGTAVDGHIMGLERRYYILAGKNPKAGEKHTVLFELVPAPNGMLRYNGSDLRGIMLTKITEAETQDLLAKKAEERQSNEVMLKKARGLWAVKSGERGTPWTVMEITDNTFIKDGKSIPIVGKMLNEEAVFCSADKPNEPILILKEISADGNRIAISENRNWGFPSFTDARNYERTTPDELRMRNEPKLEDFKGFWKLDNEDAPVCRILAFEVDRVMRDGHVEPIESRSNSTILRIMRPSERDSFVMMNVIHPSKDKIEVCYGDFAGGTWFTYHRLTSGEIKAEMQQTNNIVGKLAGYWKSVKPVHDGQYAYAKIQLHQYVNNKLLDTFEFLGTNKLNSSNKTKSVGVLGYPDGKTDKPLYCLNNNGQPAYDAFILVDDNKMTYTESNKNPIDFVRINANDAPPLFE